MLTSFLYEPSTLVAVWMFVHLMYYLPKLVLIYVITGTAEWHCSRVLLSDLHRGTRPPIHPLLLGHHLLPKRHAVHRQLASNLQRRSRRIVHKHNHQVPMVQLQVSQ